MLDGWEPEKEMRMISYRDMSQMHKHQEEQYNQHLQTRAWDLLHPKREQGLNGQLCLALHCWLSTPACILHTQLLLLAGVKHSHARRNHREGRTAPLLSTHMVPVSQECMSFSMAQKQNKRRKDPSKDRIFKKLLSSSF